MVSAVFDETDATSPWFSVVTTTVNLGALPLAPTRTVTWTNEGTLTHNVTIPQINFSQDFKPGQTITIKDLGKKLGGAGTYQFFCRFHEQLGMIGTLIIK